MGPQLTISCSLLRSSEERMHGQSGERGQDDEHSTEPDDGTNQVLGDLRDLKVGDLEEHLYDEEGGSVQRSGDARSRLQTYPIARSRKRARSEVTTGSVEEVHPDCENETGSSRSVKVW